MQKVNKWQYDFILEVYLLLLSIKGMIECLNATMTTTRQPG